MKTGFLKLDKTYVLFLNSKKTESDAFVSKQLLQINWNFIFISYVKDLWQCKGDCFFKNRRNLRNRCKLRNYRKTNLKSNIM